MNNDKGKIQAEKPNQPKREKNRPAIIALLAVILVAIAVTFIVWRTVTKNNGQEENINIEINA